MWSMKSWTYKLVISDVGQKRGLKRSHGRNKKKVVCMRKPQPFKVIVTKRLDSFRIKRVTENAKMLQVTPMKRW